MEKHTLRYDEGKLWNKAFITMLILNTAINSASQMVVPLVTSFAQTELNTSLTVASTMASLMSMAALFIRPISGMSSDRYSRKLIVIISNCVIAACIAAMPLCKAAGESGVYALTAIRLIHGVAFSFNGVALMAFSTSFVPKSRMGEGMGWMAVSNIVAQAIGPNIGIALRKAGGFSLCFTVASIGCVVGAVLIAMVPYKFVRSETQKKITLDSLISIRILPYAAILCLFSAGNGLSNALLVTFAEERSIPGIEFFFTAYSVTMVVLRLFFGKVVDQKGLRVALYPSIVAAGVAFAVLAHANALWVVIFVAILKAIGQGNGTPAVQSACLNQLGRDKAGVASSTCFIGQDVGNSLAPILGGYVAEHFGFTALFNGYAVVMLVAGIAIFAIKWSYDAKKYGYRA